MYTKYAVKTGRSLIIPVLASEVVSGNGVLEQGEPFRIGTTNGMITYLDDAETHAEMDISPNNIFQARILDEVGVTFGTGVPIYWHYDATNETYLTTDTNGGANPLFGTIVRDTYERTFSAGQVGIVYELPFVLRGE